MKKQICYLCGMMLLASAVQAAEVKPIDEKTLDITKEEFESMDYVGQMEYLNSKNPGLSDDDRAMLQASVEMLKKKGVKPTEKKNEKGEVLPIYQDTDFMYQLFAPADTDDEVVDQLDLKGMAERRKKAVVEPKEKDGTIYQVDVDSFK